MEKLTKRLEKVNARRLAILDELAADPSKAVKLAKEATELKKEAEELEERISKERRKKGANQLTDTKVKALKPKTKPYYESDGLGLSIYVLPTGKKSWRYRYRINDKSRTYVIGPFPEIGLADARKILHELRAQVAAGIDPVEERKKEKEAQRQEEMKEKARTEYTFGKAMEAYIESIEKSTLSESHTKRTKSLLMNYCSGILSVPVDDLDGDTHLLPIFREMAEEGKMESARKLRIAVRGAFRAAQTNRWTERKGDVTDTELIRTLLKKDRRKEKPKHLRAVLELDEFKSILAAIKEYRGDPHTRLGLLFCAHTALRNRNVRRAQWEWIDWEKRTMDIPGEEMKAGEPFTVPLTGPALEILDQVKITSGRGRYIFPSQRGDRPMSDNAMMVALKSLGIGDRTSVHGFRSSFSTIAHERGNFRHDVIEAALDHRTGDTVSRSYNRGDLLAKRRELMEWWSDLIEGGVE